MAAKKNAGLGTAIPAGVNIKGKTTFASNFAPSWHALQRQHAAQAAALLARGTAFRREIRARARL